MDRVQEVNGTIEVIDYKTGNVNPNKLSFINNDDITENKKTNILQLASYITIVNSKIGLKKHYMAGIISFKHIKAGTLWMNERVSFRKKRWVFNQDDLKNFENLVYKIIEDIHDVNSTFKNE